MPDYAPFVTFESGARLLVDLGIAYHATPHTIRYVARTHPDWPFGDDRACAYGKVANARTMDTKVFLDFFREHPPPQGVRGPDKQPRQSRRPS